MRMLLSCLIASVSLTYFLHHLLSLCALTQPPAASTHWLYLPNVGSALHIRGWRWSPFPFYPQSKHRRGNILQSQPEQLMFAIFHLQDFSHALFTCIPLSGYSHSELLHHNNWHIITARPLLLSFREVRVKPQHFWGSKYPVWNSKYEEFMFHGADCEVIRHNNENTHTLAFLLLFNSAVQSEEDVSSLFRTPLWDFTSNKLKWLNHKGMLRVGFKWVTKMWIIT